MVLYLLDYGAGNVRSLANSLNHLGHSFQWITCPEDFDKASKLIFPGVGAFHSAISHLSDRGLLEPLKRYILSGKPYFGICIGLQILFNSSAESPNTSGLSIIDAEIEKFTHQDKSVPHMGWNAVQTPHAEDDSRPCKFYYFVHSYGAKLRNGVDPPDWLYTTTRYGDEVFASSVRMGNLFASQFHPEKSGKWGLDLLNAWISGTELQITSSERSTMSPAMPIPIGLTKRIVACLDVRSNDLGDLVVTKGDQYDVRETTPNDARSTVRNLGKPVALATRYFEEGADELCLLNITSFRHSPLKDQPMLSVVQAAAETVFVPLTIGGGIKSTIDPDGTPHDALEVASLYFRAGADKVSIGSEAVFIVEKYLRGEDVKQNAISSIAAVYGSQAVVISIDPRRVYVDTLPYSGPYQDQVVYGNHEDNPGRAWWYRCTVHGGRESRPLSVIELAKGVEKLGAGEILLNSIDRDGTGLGFDLQLIQQVRRAVNIPIVASSGAGASSHFVDLFGKINVEAALAAGIFHRREVLIDDVKRELDAAGFCVRPV